MNRKDLAVNAFWAGIFGLIAWWIYILYSSVWG